MNLFRTAARLMMSSYFVVTGVGDAVRPDAESAKAEALATKLAPMTQRVLPAEFAVRVPDDPKSLVRICGITRAIGGASLATGIGRRFGAGLVALSLLPQVFGSRPSKLRSSVSGENSDFLVNLALLGGAMLASQDLNGRPSLAWRANQARAQFAKDAERKKQLTKTAKRRGRRSLKRGAETARRELTRTAS